MTGAYSPQSMDFSSLTSMADDFGGWKKQAREKELRESMARGRMSDGSVISGNMGMAGEASAPMDEQSALARYGSSKNFWDMLMSGMGPIGRFAGGSM